MPKFLQEVTPGQTPTLDHASEANKVIRMINAIRNMSISPPSFGIVQTGDSDTVIDLTGLLSEIENLIKQALTNPEILEEILNNSAFRDMILELINEQLSRLSINATCGADGTINITLSIT